MSSLTHKTALITGASRGIGAAIAEHLAREGCNIVINCAKDKTGLDIVANRLHRINPNILPLQADVSDYAQTKELFQQIESSFPPVEILVNNAGISHVGLFSDTTPALWEKVIAVNLSSVLNCCHNAIGPMVKNKKGSIINISSVWGNNGASCEALYSASKGGVNSFTKALAKELGPSGIRVNAIACGPIETQMNEWLDPNEKDALTEEIPLMRFGTPKEIAELAVFLASEKAGYITGQILSADGGMS